MRAIKNTHRGLIIQKKDDHGLIIQKNGTGAKNRLNRCGVPLFIVILLIY